MLKKELLVIVLFVLLTVMVVPAYGWVIPPNPPGEDNKYEFYGPHVKGIVIRIYPDKTTEWQDMDAGNLDFEDMPLETTWINQWNNANDGQRFTVVNNGGEDGYVILDINNNWTYTSNDSIPGIDNPTRDVNLRQALAYMVNRTWIVNDLLGGLGNAMWTTVPTYMKDYVNHDIYPGGDRDALTYGGWQGNLTQAALILNTTGFPINASTGWRYWDKNGDKKQESGEDLNLIFYSRSGTRGAFGDKLNATLSAWPIMINTTYYSSCPMANVTGPILTQEYFNLYTGGWAAIGPDPDYLCDLYNGSNYYHPGTPINYDGINDPILNNYLTSIKLAPDPVAGGVACNMSQIEFATIAAAVPLWCTTDFKAYKNVPVEAGATGNWTHLVNQQGVGVNSWWSTLNIYQEGNLHPNNFTYYGFSSTVSLLNIVYSQWYWDMEVLGRIYDSGATRDPDTLSTWVPQLYTNWTIGTWSDPSAGGANKTKVTVTLRPDAYWQDNESVTMADVNYTLGEISQDLIAEGLPPPSWYPTTQYIKAVDILDPYNAEVRLDINSVWAAGWILGNPIIPEHVWKPIVDDSNTTNPIVEGRQPDPSIIGTGPFRWYSGIGDAPWTTIVLVANSPGSVVNGITSPGYYDYYPDAVYINSDGSVSPSSAPISSPDNITYTLIGDISYPTYTGIVVERSNIVIDGNGYTVQGNQSGNGLSLTGINNVTIKNTNIKSFVYGIFLHSSSNNTIYHSNFMNSNAQVGSCNSTNTWDNGYPPGGNYYINYNGTDSYRGPYQNVTGSDGIGDTPYIIDEINKDHYPLMTPWIENPTRYPWPMFHSDVCHTGYSESPAANTNKTLWNYTTGGYVYSPVVAYGKVYVGSGDNKTYCLDALTGRQIWNYSTGGLVLSCPAVSDGKVYVGSYDRNVYCLDALTGAQIWNYTTGNWVYSSPTVADGKVYVGSFDTKVYCLDALTGAQIWNYTTSYQVRSSPAVADGRIYVGSDDSKVYCLDALTGAQIWNYTTGNYVTSSPAVADGRIYVGSDDSKVYCLDALTGAQIWNYTAGGPVASCPAVADGRVYVGSDDNNVYCLDALSGVQMWNYTTGYYVMSSPAVADGRVFVGSYDGKVYCLNESTGAFIWNYMTGLDWVHSSPAVADGLIFVGSDNGVLNAIGSVVRVPEDFKTIQAAINAASPGDTISIAPGVYNESVVVNKTVTILGRLGSEPVFAGGGSGIAISILPSASGSIVAGITVTSWDQGILIAGACNCKIYDTIMSQMSSNGIAVMGTSAVNNQIWGNIFQNDGIAINVTFSSGNTYCKNVIVSNVYAGISLQSNGNVIYANTISANGVGINMTNSNGNVIYHNDFIDNTIQVTFPTAGNTWDNGYPSGGNYWSSMAVVDFKSGVNQDVSGSDGINDTGYTIAISNRDRYPLTKPFNQHDIGITSLYAEAVVGRGSSVNVSVRLVNYGLSDETFTVKCHANAILAASQMITLGARSFSTVTLVWDTTSFACGTYVMSVYATPVQGETDTADNTLAGTTVQIVQPNGGGGKMPYAD